MSIGDRDRADPGAACSAICVIRSSGTDRMTRKEHVLAGTEAALAGQVQCVRRFAGRRNPSMAGRAGSHGYVHGVPQRGAPACHRGPPTNRARARAAGRQRDARASPPQEQPRGANAQRSSADRCRRRQSAHQPGSTSPSPSRRGPNASSSMPCGSASNARITPGETRIASSVSRSSISSSSLTRPEPVRTT